MKTSFTGRFHAYYLIFFETYQYINKAIAREKELKGWKRERKMQLINEQNPSLEFLNKKILGEWPPVDDNLVR